MDNTVSMLRQRAARLRAVAERLTVAPLHALAGHAGTDTWVGPAADEYRSALTVYRGDASSAGENLRWQASRLDELADQREAQLLTQQGTL